MIHHHHQINKTLLSQLVILLAALTSSCQCGRSIPANESAGRHNYTQLQAVRLKWRQMELMLSESMSNLSQQLAKQLQELQGTNNQSRCLGALNELVEALGQQRLWSSRMLDASAHLPSGLLEGTVTELGNFDQCLAVDSRLDGADEFADSLRHADRVGQTQKRHQIVGQYCSLFIKPALPARPRFHTICQRIPGLSSNQTNRPAQLVSRNAHLLLYSGLRLGICVPSRCEAGELQQLLANYLSNKYQLHAQVKSCQVLVGPAGRDPAAPTGLTQVGQPLDELQWCIVATFGGLILLAVMGTLADWLVGRPKTSGEVPASRLESTASRRWHYHMHQQSSLGAQRNPLASSPSSSTLESAGKASSPDDSDESWVRRLAHSEAAEWSLEDQSSANGECHVPVKRDPQVNHSRSLQFLLCFSMPRNLTSIMGGHSSSDGQGDMADVGVIHGIRVLTMLWIIFGHSIGLVAPEMMNNLFALVRSACQSRPLQAFLNATLAVNTFFMISGLVFALSAARKCHKLSRKLGPPQAVAACQERSSHQQHQRRFEPGSSPSSLLASSCASSASSSSMQPAAAHSSPTARSSTTSPTTTITDRSFRPLVWLILRYLRLMPAHLATIGLAVLMPQLGSGPFWPELIGAQAQACRRAWWLNLLQVNNLLATDRICLIHSWYISNDTQFFLLGLLIVAVFRRSRAWALVLTLAFALAGGAATFALTVINDFPPTIVSTSPAVAERWTYIHALYYKPWPHVASYLVGLLAGFRLESCRRRSKSSTGPWPRLVSLLVFLLAMALLNSIHPWNMGLQVDPLLTGLHGATFRTLWAACCAWLILLLHERPANPLARLLAWSGFRPLSRLTYAAYLVHPLLIYHHLGSLRERMDSSGYWQLERALALVCLSYLAALVLSMLVESPLVQLMRLWANCAGCKSMPQARCSRQRLHSDSSASSAPILLREQTNNRLGPTVWLAAGLHPGSQLDGNQTGKQSLGSVGLDAEFHQRLAQAIGKGFRLRARAALDRDQPPATPTRRSREPAKQVAWAPGSHSRGSITTFQGHYHPTKQLDHVLNTPASARKRTPSSPAANSSRSHTLSQTSRSRV